VKCAVIGAGINGACVAYLLKKKGYDVVVYEQDTIAAGGSGAAGAFLSPKFSKSGELKELINSALDEAFEFYTKNFPDLISFYPLIHIAKDEKDAQILSYIKQHDSIPLLDNPPLDVPNQYIYTSKSAIVQAQAMVEALLEDIDVVYEKVVSIKKELQGYCINNKGVYDTVIIANGAYTPLVEEAYLHGVIRGIWGHRIDITTTTPIPVSLHQFVSISPTKNKQSAIGATHDVHFHPEKSLVYDFEKGRLELLQKAQRTLKLENVEILRDYVGLRSGSSDYLPVVGKIVDSIATKRHLTRKELESKQQDFSQYIFYEGLYMINGSAGYGFVLAPMLAQIVVDAITTQKDIPKSLDNARFFARYVRRNF